MAGEGFRAGAAIPRSASAIIGVIRKRLAAVIAVVAIGFQIIRIPPTSGSAAPIAFFFLALQLL
jgi:hypothetical protein